MEYRHRNAFLLLRLPSSPLKLRFQIFYPRHPRYRLIMGPTYSSPTLRTSSRLYRYTALAYYKRISICVVILVSYTLKVLRYSRVHGYLLGIYYGLVERRVAEHFLGFRHFR